LTRNSRIKDTAHTFAVRLMQHLVVPAFVLDAQRRVIIWNVACERLTGVAASEVVATSEHWRAFYEMPRYCLADLVALGETAELSDLYIDHTIPSDGSFGLRAENWCVMPRVGKRLCLAIDAGPIYDDDGGLIAVVETLRDITEQKLMQMALQSLAVKDGLTGLANRRSFDETLEANWLHARREGTRMSLLLADVDNFKSYNDTYGHQKGDECLKAVAGTIGEQAFRPSDLAARYGGEEFAVILPATDFEGANRVAERIRVAVEALDIEHAADLDNGRVTLSIGVASAIPAVDEDGDSSSSDGSGDGASGAGELLAAADKALYAAKHAGRNRVVSMDMMACCPQC
jgi:diguanylate cyclase (GGDEF)-like protein